MDYMTRKEKCTVCETVFEGSSEQPVDLELSLPDYCPDVERILKCRICPGISAGSITGDRLDVDGGMRYSGGMPFEAHRIPENTAS